ncbi:MAG: RecX family transcriptional regulator [Clostridia bacterium]|nr:RecX family transcriptional regulator [Clostridia bacterium]
MNEITAITPQVKDKRRCNIFVDGRFCCGLTLEATVKNRLKVGQIVSPEKLSEIQLESEKNTALDKALTHVSATRKTEKQVREFLSGKGYLPAVIDYAIEKMKGYNFLNDGEYAEAYVESAGKKKGSRLIKMELKAKGVSETEIDEALSAVDGEAQEDAAKAILYKYMRGKTADRETLQKAYRHLMGKGFEYDVAKAALASLGELDEE